MVVDLAAVQASLEAKYQAGSNGNGAGSNGNGAAANGASANGTAPAATVVVAAAVSPAASPTASVDAAEGVEGFMPPEEAGQLEAAAQEALAERERKGPAPRAAPTSAAGTPYVAPGGRWSQFKSYSTFQRTWDIWRFGLTFFFKLWCINQVRGGRSPSRAAVLPHAHPAFDAQQAAPLALRYAPAVWRRAGPAFSPSRCSSCGRPSRRARCGRSPVLQKFTYKKLPGGMSEANVSAKRSELAVWLREGLVRLGPTFIKASCWLLLPLPLPLLRSCAHGVCT